MVNIRVSKNKDQQIFFPVTGQRVNILGSAAHTVSFAITSLPQKWTQTICESMSVAVFQ